MITSTAREVIDSLINEVLKDNSSCFAGIKTPKELNDNFTFKRLLKSKIDNAITEIESNLSQPVSHLNFSDTYEFVTGKEAKNVDLTKEKVDESCLLIRELKYYQNNELGILAILTN
jgi:hypothetical protein